MIIEWLAQVFTSAAISALLVICLGFLLRNLILERLKRAVGHEYDEKLEALRLQHNRVLETLREARAEREAFRSLAFSTLSANQSATVERRIKAIEVLWQSIQDLRHTIPYYIHVADMIGYDETKFGSRPREDLRSANLIEILKPMLVETDRVRKLRPFLGDRVFALFQAAQAVIGRATSTTISSYQAGAIRLWYEEQDAQELLRVALSTDELHTFRSILDGKLDWLVRQLEAKVVHQIQDELSGKTAAAETLTNARHMGEIASKLTPETR